MAFTRANNRKVSLTFQINGQTRQVETYASVRLADVLREELGLTGTKVSCGIGRCGACAVLMDGKVVNSCLLMAFQATNVELQTIEGITASAENGVDPMQQAFLEEGGFQCGYCTPGMVVAAKALLNENQAPSDEEMAEALSGNLCRCTGYAGIIRAVRKAAKGKQSDVEGPNSSAKRLLE
ncbi:xanthine dehydrogenase subunit E [Shouchella clausii]|uniref:xanthine dehydrogenase subunit E n=1 Tax=Shouchella clausii TaxID=79880 RepID=UPI00280BCCD3|nr:xanthine dehydrogenase subunit E [Shouchella clausii]WMM33971.1 xanthine dehydrogenase subunit E [Shouchella clausii]